MEEHFPAVCACLPVGIFATDEAGMCVFANARCKVICGKDLAAPPVAAWTRFLDEAEREGVLQAWSLAAAAGCEYSKTLSFPILPGMTRWVHVRFSALPDGDETRGYVGTIEDVTEHQRVTAALRDGDRRKNEFLATLAHELRNQMQPVQNALYLLETRPSEQRSGPSRAVIHRQVGQMARLVEDLLDLSRLSRGQFELRRESVELVEVVSDAVRISRPLLEARGHTLSITLPAGGLRLEADSSRLEQILTNLLNNAAKYTEPGGSIDLLAAVEGSNSSREVVIRVRDTGIGIEPEMLPRVFDLFMQAASASPNTSGGLGIGLNLVRNLVQLHGGRVAVHSAGRGHGSEFEVRLPLRSPQQEPTSRPPAAVVPELHKSLKILVVDDNRDAAETLADVLEGWGHRTRAVFDGETALSSAAPFGPDVVVLDIGLPGLSGYEVAHRLRANASPGPGPVLVAISGYSRDEDRQRAEEAGLERYLTKPVDLHHLREVLTEIAARDVPAGRSQ